MMHDSRLKGASPQAAGTLPGNTARAAIARHLIGSLKLSAVFPKLAGAAA